MAGAATRWTAMALLHLLVVLVEAIGVARALRGMASTASRSRPRWGYAGDHTGCPSRRPRQREAFSSMRLYTKDYDAVRFTSLAMLFSVQADEADDDEGSAFLTAPFVSPPDEDEVDVAVVGAGIGGLAAGAILNTLYGKRVGVYESHYLPGGCAHAFQRMAATTTRGTTEGPLTFTFDSGPTILLG
jgi:hypothetical protein